MPPSRKKRKKTKLTHIPPLKIPQTSEESLEQINETQEHIKEVKQCLNELIDNLQHNQSFVTRSADVWGRLPTWQKVLGGIVLFGGLLTIGILMHVAVLIAITCVCATAYIGIGLSLDNHYAVENNSRDRLAASMLNLANMFGHMINALENIRKQLATEIDRLKHQINKLDESIVVLDQKIEVLQDTTNLLGSQLEQLALTEDELNTTKNELLQIKNKLAKKIDAFSVIESGLELNINELNANNLTLRGTIETLSAEIIKDQETRQDFLAKLDDFLENKETNFHQIVGRICQAEDELVHVQSELKRCIKHYQKLLSTNETQVVRLTRAADILLKPRVHVHKATHQKKHSSPFFDVNGSDKRVKPPGEQTLQATILSKHGFRAQRKRIVSTDETTQPYVYK